MRRVGIIVDGQSEFGALPSFVRRIPNTRSQVVGTLLAPIPPKASAGVIANSCRSRVDILIRRGATEIIVLLDREDRPECPGQWALEIGEALKVPADCHGCVVVKNQMFENWLIADLETLKSFPRRYTITAAMERRVRPDRADSCDALRLLKDITGHDYSKVSDSRKILSAADPANMAANSRSFRRLMRVLGSELYRDQSRRPA